LGFNHSKSIYMNTFITNVRKIFFALLAFLLVGVWQSWTSPDFPENATNSAAALQVVGAWNRLLPSQRTTLENGGTVTNFDLGICDAMGTPITADITSSGAPNAPTPGTINTRRPRRWGNTSFYLARETANQAGVQYCFDFSAAVSFSMDSREHAYFANGEALTISANNAGAPVDLNATFLGSPTFPGNGMSGNGTSEVTLNAFSTEGGGLWWEVNSLGMPVTQVCVQYYSTGGWVTAEPFRLLIDGVKCVDDDPVICGGTSWISRWNRLNTTQRVNLQEGTPVYGFNTGFCDESSDVIQFLEITAGGAPHSGNPGFQNGKEPRPYGQYSFDNGRHFAGMGGNTYCFTLDEARPIRLNSQEHRFFQSGEVVHLTAFLGVDPVILEGQSGVGPVIGNAGGLTLNGSGYGEGVVWDINSQNRPVSKVCVEYFVEGGAPLGREPFALGICATRCMNDDPYACSQVGGVCQYPQVDIQKTVTPLNGFGLDLCNNPGSGLPVFEVTIIMTGSTGGVKQLFLEEDLMKYFGPAYDYLLTPPAITFSNAGTPGLNPNFNGITDTDIFIPGSGSLGAGQEIHVSFLVELNPNAPGAQTNLVNSVYGGGIAPGGGAYNDVSGSLPGGPGFPTAFQNLPAGYSAIPAQDLTLEATIPNFMNGINDWLANHGGASFNVPGCGAVTWTNDYDPANFIPGCGQITGSIEVTFTATNACGYVMTTCATFTLEDTIGPVCTKPVDLTLDCGDPNALAILQDWLDYDGNYTDLSTPVVFTNDFMGLGNAGCNSDPITVTWTATDACGNESYFSATLTVVDNTAPTLVGVVGDLMLDRCDSIPDPANVTATDGCDLNPELEFSETTMGDDCHFTITRTWTATDECGNSAVYVQTITVADNNPPVFSNVPVDTTAECPDVPPVQDPTVTDCSSFTVEFTEVQIGGACPLPSQIIRTWIATDSCGNVDSVKQIVNMTSPMVISEITFDPPNPSDITAACSDNPMFDDVQATTTCPAGGLSVSVEDVVNNNGDCSQPFSVTRTWIAHDNCGNMVSVSQTMNIGPDTEAPIFHTGNPTDIMVDCGDDPVLPIAFDNCGATSLSYVDSDRTGDCATGFTFVRTWTATDLCGNSSTFAQNVNTTPDNSPPVFITVPYDQFFDCDDPVIFDEPEVFDNCSDVTLTWQDSIIGTGDCNEVNGQIYGYDIIRTWTATDSCGNSATLVTNAWILPGYNNGNRIAFSHVPEDQHFDCRGDVVFGQAVCHSACGELALTFEDFYNEDCDNGTTITRVWTAVDTCGNEISATQLISIEPDNEAPTFMSVPADGLFDCNDGTPVFGQPTVIDNCGTGASIIMTHNDVWENGGDCNSFKVTRTWTAVDPCGNESIASQTLTLMDNIAPVFETTLLDKTVGCGDAIIFDQVEVTENCSNAQVSFTDSAVDLCGGSYAITRTWLAEDACGNVSSASQTVTVMDDEGPVFDMVPADKTISCGEALVFGQAEASDVCSFAELSFEDEMTLSCEGSYTVTRTWTATDGCGNISQAQQKITVEDTQAPVFETVVVDQYISCGEQPNFATVTAADACSNVSVTFVDVEEVLACETLVTRTWTALDACGNSAQLSQSVHIMDNDSPVFNALPTFLEMTQAEFMAWTPPTAIATDCGEVTIEVNSSSESNCDFITYTYNYVATDGCGNSSSHHLEVLITDAVFAMTVEAPAELDCGENYDLLLNTVNGTAPFAYSWQIVSGTDWQVDAMPGQPMATVFAGEGEAVLNVSIMDAVGCVVSQEVTLDCEAGVNAVTFAEISSFELKPNPVSDVLRVAFYSKIAGEAKVKILNTLGSQMALTTKEVMLGSNQFDVEAASLPAGTYLLQLQLGDKVAVEKFVKIN
jgi:hypothetical protein